MRKLTLILIALCTLCAFGAAVGVASEAAPATSAVDTLSAFAADDVELELMLIFSGEKSSFEPKASNNCYEYCQPVLQSCLAQCGGGFLCDMQCNAAFDQCIADCS